MAVRIVIAALLVVGCHPPSRDEQLRREDSAYAAGEMWACRPDLPGDSCHGDLTATELHADGTRTIVPHVPAPDPPIDCFYVYPTVDMHLRKGNHAELDDVGDVRDTVRSQIARFTETCAVYAPFYRQVSIGTYLADDSADKDHYFAVAYSDVAAAFRYYMAHYNHGRRVALIGHSQGAQMIVMLIHDTFDRDEALRRQLVVAMPIGFYFDAPTGATVGGTFANLVACTTDAQTGCIVTYRSIASGDRPEPKFWKLAAGHTAMCVNPAGAGKMASLSRAYFPNAKVKVDGVTTPFVLVRDRYQGRCVADPGGRDFFEISEQAEPGDLRPSLVNLAKHHGFIGLHIFDLQFTQGDLIDLIKKKLAPPS